MCPCGTGKKYKHCCLTQQDAARPLANGRLENPAHIKELEAALAHCKSGRFSEARQHCEKVLSSDPDNAHALHYLGFIEYRTGKIETAIQLMGRSAQIAPSASCLNNLGLAFEALGHLDSARGAYQQALLLDPKLAGAHNNLGNVCRGQRQLDDALAHFERAIALDPKMAETYSNIGLIYSYQGKLEQAAQYFEKSVSIRPDFAEAYTNLLFLKSFASSSSPDEYLGLARSWESRFVPPLERKHAREKTQIRQELSGRRLRVGYVSGDYRHHAVAYFIAKVFEHHDQSRVELFAYSSGTMHDDVTARLKGTVNHWVEIFGASDAEVLARIEADQIDVLIDLSGHTKHERLGVFARRAAPVQASYLGYFASTGLTEMDYWIGDEILTRKATDSQFSEEVWRLPRAWVSYCPLFEAPEPVGRTGTDSTVWFGCFNSLLKLTAESIALWSKLLLEIPEGVLLLKTKLLEDVGNQRRVLAGFAHHGVATERIILEGESQWEDYMDAYNRIDIALDPVGGHSGGTISCDALWMGVPVIHATGTAVTSRFTESILTALGRPEWVCETEDAYIASAAALARDPAARKAIRLQQREQFVKSPLGDAKDLTQHLEAAYFRMFERWQSKQGEIAPAGAQHHG